jgi:hypothetical protein
VTIDQRFVFQVQRSASELKHAQQSTNAISSKEVKKCYVGL